MATQVSSRARTGSSDELAVIAQRAQAFTNASATAIALSEGKADEIICRARAGSNAPEVGTALRVEGTFTGLCIRSGTELCCDDAETDTRVDKAAIRALGIRSMAVIPIKEEGRVVGVLAAFAPTAHAFNATHVVVLKTMADQVAAYLKRKQRDPAYSPAALPAPPVKALPGPAAPVPAAAPSLPPPAVGYKPAAPAATQRQPPVAPRVEPPQANTVPTDIDPVALFKKKKPTIHDEPKEPAKSTFRPTFTRRDAAVAPEISRREVPAAREVVKREAPVAREVVRREAPAAREVVRREAPAAREISRRDAAYVLESKPRAKVVMIGVAAVVVIAGAVGFSYKLRRPTATPQPAVETPSSLGVPAAQPAPAPTIVQPPVKLSPAVPPANFEAMVRPDDVPRKPEKTVVISGRPSRISRGNDNLAPAVDAPAMVGSLPATGNLTSLTRPDSAPPHLRSLSPSELEPIRVIKRVSPVYPLVAKTRRMSASVVVQGIVDKDGKIYDLQLISGPQLFREAAFEALRQWVFKPAKLNGEPIEQPTTIRVNFGAQ